MRLYIYLDRSILRTIFSVIDNDGFDIEVVEYSVRKSYTKNNQISLKPGVEKVCNNEKDVTIKECEENEQFGRRRCGDIDKEYLGVGFDHGNSCSVQTERRYINIEDITDMKNRGFYHKLIENIRMSKNRTEHDRICEISGYVIPFHNRNNESDTNGFFTIGDTHVWFNKAGLDGNIDFYSNFGCKINVIGYRVNCFEDCDRKIIKAIAMYIE